MIYSLFKFLFKVTVHSYFRKLNVSGEHNIPASGPVIFVANHPSALIDPLVITTSSKRTIHSIAAAEFFGGKWQSWLLKNEFHMIPVYRPSTQENSKEHNKSMFTDCHQLLMNNGALLIFPEGTSETKRGIGELKTGAARIALEAEQLSKDGLSVKIVPIGLNYTSPHQFRSDLFIKIGTPVCSSNIIDNSVDRVKDFTNLIKKGLIETLLHTRSEKLNKLTRGVETIYQDYLEESIQVDAGDTERHFEVQKKIIQATAFIYDNQTAKAEEISKKIGDHLKVLREHEIRLKRPFRKPDIQRFAHLILGIPFSAIGYVMNLLPFLLTKLISRQMNMKASFRGTLSMMIGMVIFIIWYLGISLAVTMLFDHWIFGVIIFITGYGFGLYALYFSKLLMEVSQQLKIYKLKISNPKLYKSLMDERNYLVQTLDEMRVEFEQNHSASID